MECDADGVYRWVVAHRDPGIHNWVDTTGQPHGYLTIRWTYEKQPPKEMWPSLQVKKVSFKEIREHFPVDTRKVTQAEREHAILLRHRHVQRRYRQY